MLWLTSDWHFGHANLLTFDPPRPFTSIKEHDAELIRRHNAVVAPEDDVLVLGDVAMGNIEESLAKCAQMHGCKILVCGNHDRPAMRPTRAAHWIGRYQTEGGFKQVFIDPPAPDELVPVDPHAQPCMSYQSEWCAFEGDHTYGFPDGRPKILAAAALDWSRPTQVSNATVS